MGILFSNELYSGYSFSALHPSLHHLVRCAALAARPAERTQDHFNGIFPRWHIIFPLTMLRLVSFGVDHHRALLTTRQSLSPSRFQHDYSFSAMIAYVLYPPLYIAGPIITANDFLRQLCTPGRHSHRTLITYGLRLVAALSLMELRLHVIYSNAIKEAQAWHALSISEFGLCSWAGLFFIWLKVRHVVAKRR